jgi:hypothetical protein
MQPLPLVVQKSHSLPLNKYEERYGCPESGTSPPSAKQRPGMRLNYWSNMRRGTATSSQDSGTSPPSAKQRPGMRLNYWSNRRRVMESGTSLLSAKQRPGMRLNYWSNRRRVMESGTSPLSAKQRPCMLLNYWSNRSRGTATSSQDLRHQPSRDQVSYSITGLIGGQVMLPGVFKNISTVSQAATRYATQLLVE